LLFADFPRCFSTATAWARERINNPVQHTKNRVQSQLLASVGIILYYPAIFT